jgi:hypothetical protein
LTEQAARVAPQDPQGKLSALQRDHPAYEIRLITAEVWEAVSRPAPGRTVVDCAHDLAGLRAKLEAAGNE